MNLQYKDYSFINTQGRSLLETCAVFQLVDTIVEKISVDIGQTQCLQSFMIVLECYLSDDEYRAFSRYLSKDLAENLREGVKKKKHEPRRRKTDV